MTDTVTIQPLTGNHDKDKFDCGNDELNRWLKQQAGQSDKKNLAKTSVAVPNGLAGLDELGLDWATEHSILGFFALSAAQVNQAEQGDLFPRKLPREIPLVRLSRLAVDKRAQGMGLGKMLLMHALDRACAASESVGAMAVFVDAKDDAARQFYLRAGFHETTDELKLYILMTELRARLKA